MNHAALLSPHRALEPLRQPEGSGQCGQTCVAMLAGVSVAEVCRRFNSYRGTTVKQLARILTDYGFTILKGRGETVHPVAVFVTKDPSNIWNCGHWVLLFHGAWYCPSTGINPRWMAGDGVKLLTHLAVFAPTDNPTNDLPGLCISSPSNEAAKMDTGPKLCKGDCGQPVRPPRRTWCEDPACRERWLAWHYLSFAKHWVRRRDRGVCAACGLDCRQFRHDMRQWWGTDRPRYDRMKRLHPYFKLDRKYYEIDHIQERAAGGDDTPDNLQTLCYPCHLGKTVAFNENRPHPKKPCAKPSSNVCPPHSAGLPLAPCSA